MKIYYSEEVKKCLPDCVLGYIRQMVLDHMTKEDFIQFLKLRTDSQDEHVIEIRQTDKEMKSHTLILKQKLDAPILTKQIVAIRKSNKIIITTERDFLKNMLDSIE